MIIAIGNDHASVDMKFDMIKYLESLGHQVINVGTDVSESCNYPVYAKAVCEKVNSGEADCGICICGTGVGMSLACNKVEGIRAVVCSEPFSAKLSKQHNNTNVLCFGSRVIGIEMAKMIVDNWLGAEFEGGRHAIRVGMVMDIEKEKIGGK